VRSSDAGKTWESVSELGRADFHAIQTSGEAIVAGRYGEPAIDVSTDGGKTFANKRPPDPLVDLEVDPEDPRRWVATTQSRIFTSSDQGGSWRQRDPVPNARLAWRRRRRCSESIRADRSSAARTAERPAGRGLHRRGAAWAVRRERQ
jgi:photosystem II stability/assembly factor-like uncharacterized protein